MWSSSSVNNENTLDYPDILIAGIGRQNADLTARTIAALMAEPQRISLRTVFAVDAPM